MLTAACPDAVRLLVDTMQDENVKRDLRVDCANTIIERVLGKAAQPIIADPPTNEEHMTLKEMLEAARDLMQS